MVRVEDVRKAFEFLKEPQAIPFPYITDHLNEVRRKKNASFETFISNSNFTSYNAVIGWKGQSYRYGYKEGFFNIAHGAIIPAAHQSDVMVFPIIFNYRQYLELVLKENITRFEILLRKPISNNKTHDIHELLNRLITLLEPAGYTFLISDVQKKVIHDFMKIDEKNDTFRFVYNHEGKFSHKYDHKLINLLELHYTMNEVYNDFNAIDYLFDDEGFFDEHYLRPELEALFVALNSYFTSSKNRKGVNSLAMLRSLIFDFTFEFDKNYTFEFNTNDTNIVKVNDNEYEVIDSQLNFSIILYLENKIIKSLRVN